MKQYNQYLFVFIITILFICACHNKMKQKPTIFNQHKNIVVAHRGAWKNLQLPENSIASLRQAIKLNCTGSEFDVHMTADDSLVINHDPQHHSLVIEDHTYQDLVQYPLSNGESLPTLRQYLEAGRSANAGTQLVIELKPTAKGKARAEYIVKKTYELVKKLHMEHKVSFISFDLDMLVALVALDKNVITQYLNGDLAPDQIKALHISGLDYNHTKFRLHPDWILQAKKLQLILNVWTVNNREDLQYFKDAGFDYITTNEPELLMSMIHQ